MIGPRRHGLRADRRPGSLDEARTMVAYNQRILETSQSSERRDRAARMLVNLQPWIAELEQRRTCPDCGKPRPPGGSGRCPDCVLEQRRLAAIEKLPAPRRPEFDDDDFEVVWSGKDDSLSNLVKH